MSRKRSEEAIEAFRPRFVEGCLGNGIDEPTAHTIYDKLVGFSGFGFPKSHAAAFGAARLPVGVAAALLPGRVPLLAPERPADGLLPAGLARPRRPAPRRRGAPAAREPQRRPLHRRGRRGPDRPRLHPLGRRRARPRRSPPSSRSPTSATSPRARSAGKDALEALVASGACDDWGPRRELLWRLGVTPRGESAGGGNRQLALPLEPTAEIPELRPQTDWERMLADYRHTSISVGRPPARAPPPAPPPGLCREQRARPASRTARGSPSPASPSPASARRLRRASSSCCSRTSTAR